MWQVGSIGGTQTYRALLKGGYHPMLGVYTPLRAPIAEDVISLFVYSK